MKQIVLAVIMTGYGITAFTQISCNKLFETSDALKNGSIKGEQISKDTLQSTVIWDDPIDSYIVIHSTWDVAHFIFLRTYSKKEAINKYEELRDSLKKCKPADWKGYESERAYSIIISDGFYITANYYNETKESPEYTVLIRITQNL